jgi:hypothetical protein
MSEQIQRGAAASNAEATASPATPAWRQKMATWVARLLNRGVVVVLLGVSIVTNGVLLAYMRLHEAAPEPEVSSPEVKLGDFEFPGHDSSSAAIRGAKFSLYIALLEGVEAPARERIAASQHRVEQAIEELLRTANSGDFEDPTLSGLKRQLQEQINGVLGMRAISEVIITDLQLEQQHVEGKRQTAGSAASAESPPG